MSPSCFDGHWTPWRPQLGQGSTDALANWVAKARAKVDWDATLARQPDNTAVHVVVPSLTCIKCHPLTNAYGDVISYPCSDRSQDRLLCERAVEDWKHRYRGYYEWVDYEPRFGGYDSSYAFSIMICYQLKRCPIQDCAAQGPNLKAAKSVAAQRLLESGHCMIRL